MTPRKAFRRITDREMNKLSPELRKRLSPELQELALKEPLKCRKELLNAMKKYGKNHWWNSEDPVYVAKHQIFEPVLLTPNFSLFHKGMEKLLGRPVYTSEFGLNLKGLQNEAKEAVIRLRKGERLERSPAEKARKFNEAIKQLEKTGKTTLFWNVKDKNKIAEEVDTLFKTSVKKKKDLL